MDGVSSKEAFASFSGMLAPAGAFLADEKMPKHSNTIINKIFI
jgi:hypothetical protein